MPSPLKTTYPLELAAGSKTSAANAIVPDVFTEGTVAPSSGRAVPPL
jgi:hypothetical protein